MHIHPYRIRRLLILKTVCSCALGVKMAIALLLYMDLLGLGSLKPYSVYVVSLHLEKTSVVIYCSENIPKLFIDHLASSHGLDLNSLLSSISDNKTVHLHA